MNGMEMWEDVMPPELVDKIVGVYKVFTGKSGDWVFDFLFKSFIKEMVNKSAMYLGGQEIFVGSQADIIAVFGRRNARAGFRPVEMVSCLTTQTSLVDQNSGKVHFGLGFLLQESWWRV